MNTERRINALYAVEWVESERGWGVRPDGYSFHASKEDAEQFIKEYQDKLPKEVPDEYSFPQGSPKLSEVSESLHTYVHNYGSVWLSKNNLESYKTFDARELQKKRRNTI